ncbi:IclR family transcriptional regulator C-terminal domain-containing protein [Labrys okinawensis]|uniref:IclR family transcriptional regulator domain-containing protein n=1 Tax=Labrys okinawensis TaxID=346911 RepID=UPI0039BC25D9
MEIKKQDFAQTLARGLACLDVLAAAPAPSTASEVAAATGVHRASARRILLTLENLGYVNERQGRFTSSPKVLALGRGLLSKMSLWSAVTPEVVSLANLVNEPCSISVLDNLSILFVVRDSTRRIYTSRLGVGDRLPAHCSASGKVLLAALTHSELERRLDGVQLEKRGPKSITDKKKLEVALAAVQEAGYATAVDEMEEGTLSISVPLHERTGRVVAAISVASHISRISASELESKVLPKLKSTARMIELTIGDFQDRGFGIL